MNMEITMIIIQRNLEEVNSALMKLLRIESKRSLSLYIGIVAVRGKTFSNIS